MAKLHEILKSGFSSKVKNKGDKFAWDGHTLVCSAGIFNVHSSILFDSNWELDEPTSEEVFEKSDWRMNKSMADGMVVIGRKKNQLVTLACYKPRTYTEATRIIEFLESL